MSDNKGKKMSMNSNIGSSPTKGDQGMQSPNQGNLNQAYPVNMPKFSEDEVLSLDNDLVELRQKYIEAKKNRKIVEVNEKNIQNKMELLSSKEVEAQKRLQVSNQNQIENCYAISTTSAAKIAASTSVACDGNDLSTWYNSLVKNPLEGILGDNSTNITWLGSVIGNK